jgi:hypothetical protein
VRAFRLWSGFIDPQSAASNFFSIKIVHSLGGFFIFLHFDKGESTRLASFPIVYDVDARDLAEGLDQGSQVAFCSLKTHVAYENVFHCCSLATGGFLRSAFKKSAKLFGS